MAWWQTEDLSARVKWAMGVHAEAMHDLFGAVDKSLEWFLDHVRRCGCLVRTKDAGERISFDWSEVRAVYEACSVERATAETA